ncbi:MAG: lipase maturation factor family protein [Acidobacteriota bacterium]
MQHPAAHGPVLIFDGDCGFCRLWVERWRSMTGSRVLYVPYQEDAWRLPEVPVARFAESVHLLEPDGKFYRGAEAVLRCLTGTIGGRLLLGAYRLVPGFRPLAELAYRFVARHRRLASRLTRLLWGRSVQPPSYLLTRWVLLKGLGIIYLLAFASLLPQVNGLLGPDGILPAERIMRLAHEQVGRSAYWLVPTLAWLHPAGSIMTILCVAGVALAALLIAGLVPAPSLILLWGTYLSIVSVGQDFLAFQWDLLLLEVGFIAIFLAPWGLRPGLGRRSPPPRLIVWLLMGLLFRLMLGSGLVKLWSGDASWSDLTALTLHYETQPLPTPLAWWAHQAPVWIHQASGAALFGIELVLPFLIPLPRRPRLVAAGGFALLMGIIAATGNYGFFNLLTLVLCVVLLDDAVLTRLLPARLSARLAEFGPAPPASGLRRVLTGLVFLVLGGLSTTLFVGRFAGFEQVPVPIRTALARIRPLRSINTYGLFSVMTRSRPEIRIEGSLDGRDWKPYRFRYKMNGAGDAPPWIAPYMPRLDWQMWFAPLGSCRSTRWFPAFEQRLLEGSRPVLDLLAKNPFPDQPPRLLRTFVDDYRFTHAGASDSGAWWRVTPGGPYCPVATRRAR